MVILTGSGHVAFGSGIPERLERRARVAYTIVLNADEAIEPGSADYVLLARERTLPPGGALGVRVEEYDGGVRIASLSADGAAEKGGLEKGDVLVSINGESIETAADVRLALWDARPGDRVPVAVRRKRLIKTVERDFEIELQAREP
jgi:S1-C subfamily serine protease